MFCNQIQTNMLHEADTDDMEHHLFSNRYLKKKKRQRK